MIFPEYSEIIVYVGLVISSSISSPRATPFTKVVLPAPKVPLKAIILPGLSFFARFLPISIDSSADCEIIVVRGVFLLFQLKVYIV